MRQLWCVLVPLRQLTRTDTRYHEFGSAGVTKCGRKFKLPDTMRHSKDETTMVWVIRKQARRFATVCRRCQDAK